MADPLITAYRTAWYGVLEEQDKILEDPRQWRRARRLEEMSRTIGSAMDDLDSLTSDWMAEQFPKVYGKGLVDGANAAGTEAVWSAIHQEAVEQLAFGIYEDLLSATTHVKGTTKDLIRLLARQAGTTALIAGETAQAAGRTLAKQLAANSITAVIYKDGSRHGLAEYAEMNLRSTTALGYNNGTLNASPKTVYWEVFDGPGCGWTFHADTEQALGKIVTRDEALSYPISHPNCRRSFGPRPDLNKTASAAEKLGSVKDSQVVAQRAQDAERLAKQARAASRRRAAGRPPRAPRTPRKSTAPAKFPGGMTADEAQAWMTQKYPHVKWNYKGLDPEVANQMSETMDDLMQRYPKTAARLRSVGGPDVQFPSHGYSKIGKSAYAEASPKDMAIRLSSKFAPGPWRSPGISRDYGTVLNLKSDADIGWHPKGTGDVKGVVSHEFGHHVYWEASPRMLKHTGDPMSRNINRIVADHAGEGNITDLMKSGAFNNLIERDIGKYALTDQQELFAEAFAMVEGGQASPVATAIVERVVGVAEA